MPKSNMNITCSPHLMAFPAVSFALISTSSPNAGTLAAYDMENFPNKTGFAAGDVLFNLRCRGVILDNPSSSPAADSCVLTLEFFKTGRSANCIGLTI